MNKGFWENILLKIFSAENHIDKISKKIEFKIDRIIRKTKRKIFATVFSLLFLALSIISLSVGGIIFLNRFIPADILLILAGVLFLVIALFIMLLN